jgi:hypothetical protein
VLQALFFQREHLVHHQVLPLEKEGLQHKA